MIMLDPRQLQCSFSRLVDNTEIIKFHKMPMDEVQVLGKAQDKKASRKWLYCLTILEILLLLTAGYLIYRSAKFHMISRKEWGAVEPIYKNLLGLPVPNVVIDENPFECNTTESCIFYLKELQRYRIESTIYADIDSNFYIGGDGLIYEGTGWHINPMPMGIVYHEVSYISICVLGEMNKMETVQRQWNAIKRLVAQGVRLENIKPDYNLYSRHQFDKNGNTGSMLYELIQKSNHFSTNISWLYPKFDDKKKV